MERGGSGRRCNHLNERIAWGIRRLRRLLQCAEGQFSSSFTPNEFGACDAKRVETRSRPATGDPDSSGLSSQTWVLTRGDGVWSMGAAAPLEMGLPGEIAVNLCFGIIITALPEVDAGATPATASLSGGIPGTIERDAEAA